MRFLNGAARNRFLITSIAIGMVRSLVGVESFVLSPLLLTPSHKPQQYYSLPLQTRSKLQPFSSSHDVEWGRKEHPAKSFICRYQPPGVILRSSNNGGDNFDANENDGDNANNGALSSVVNYVGLASQPVVWVSLYSVATTGGGLPAGPGGSIGALEGLSYLIVLVLALLPTSWTMTSINGASETPGDSGAISFSTLKGLSSVTIGLGLTVLAGLAADRGCVPNAKPILDYSAYLPVCSSDF